MAKKGKKVIRVDFTGVSAEGGKLIDEGPILLEVDEIEQEVGADSKEPYLAFKFKVADDGEFKGTSAYDNFSLQPQSLWKLRGFMEAAGLETVDGPMDIDPDEMIGLLVIGDIIHEAYKGKDKHRVNGYSPAEEDDSQKKTPATTTKKKPSKQPEWELKTKVKFKDGKTQLEGVITEIDEKEGITVKVGKDEYVVDPDDLEAA